MNNIPTIFEVPIRVSPGMLGFMVYKIGFELCEVRLPDHKYQKYCPCWECEWVRIREDDTL